MRPISHKFLIVGGRMWERAMRANVRGRHAADIAQIPDCRRPPCGRYRGHGPLPQGEKGTISKQIYFGRMAASYIT